LPAVQQGGRAGFYTIGVVRLQDKYATDESERS